MGMFNELNTIVLQKPINCTKCLFFVEGNQCGFAYCKLMTKLENRTKSVSDSNSTATERTKGCPLDEKSNFIEFI